MAVTPAGAEVSSAVATNWKKIWKKNLKPLAAKNFYTKKQSKSRFQPKGSYETAGSGYTKAETDAKYEAAGSGYTKADSDAKYAPFPGVIRGSWSLMDGGYSGAYVSTDINWGYNFPAALVPHYIASGAVPPAGCSGTVAAPIASPGHLCVFEFGKNGIGTVEIRNVSNLSGATSPFGANLFSTTTSAAPAYAYGSWAARGTGLAVVARVAPKPSAPSGSTDPGN